MAKLRFKIRDQSRFQKKYPLTRHLPKTRLISDQVFEMETHTINVSNSDTLTMEFEAAFSQVPNVVATLLSSDSATGDVNVWVSGVSTTQCTINFSASVVGQVMIQATVLGS